MLMTFCWKIIKTLFMRCVRARVCVRAPVYAWACGCVCEVHLLFHYYYSRFVFYSVPLFVVDIRMLNKFYNNEWIWAFDCCKVHFVWGKHFDDDGYWFEVAMYSFEKQGWIHNCNNHRIAGGGIARDPIITGEKSVIKRSIPIPQTIGNFTGDFLFNRFPKITCTD